jgi:hypothetical protein
MPEQKPERSTADVLPPDLLFAYPEWSGLSRRLATAETPSEIRALSEQKSQWEQMHGPHAKGLFEQAEAYLASKSKDDAWNGVGSISKSPLAELSTIGLSVPIDEEAARNLWASLLRIDAGVRSTPPDKPAEPVREAYRTIAKHVVTADTPDQVLEEMIPRMIFSFYSTRPWSRYPRLEILRGVLEPCIIESQAARLQMAPAPGGARNQ